MKELTANEGKLAASGAPVCTTFESLDETGDERSPGGVAGMAMCLGVSAVPAPPDAAGEATLYIDEDLRPRGVAVGGFDPRSADVVAQLAPGESALHATGAGYASRVFCKEQLVAIVVGDDTMIVVDRKNEAITVNGFGHHVELSADNGILLAEAGGASISLSDGSIVLNGSVTLGSGPTAAKMYLVGTKVPPAPGAPVPAASPPNVVSVPMFVCASGTKA